MFVPIDLLNPGVTRATSKLILGHDQKDITFNQRFPGVFPS